MAGFIQNILWNSVEGFVEAGTRTAGQYAGDALIKAGDMIENSGRSVGNGIERRASNYGSAITGQSYQPGPKALPSTARKPAIKRSNSSPASSKPASTKSVGPSGKTPLGANKYPGGAKQITGATGAAKKQITSGAAGAKSVAGGASKGVTNAVGPYGKALGGSVSAVKSTVPTPKALPKPYPNNVPYGAKATPQNTGAKAKNSISAAKGTAESKADNLPKPYGGNAYPNTEKKSAVRPGQSKPFKAPEEKNKEDASKQAPYPGTNTLPGQGSRTPVNSRKQRYKPAERLGSQVESGQKMQHITV